MARIRARTGNTDWSAIALLNEDLVRCTSTLGAQVVRAAAVAEAHGPAVGWELLSALDVAAVPTTSPIGPSRPTCSNRYTGQRRPGAAYDRAIGLCGDQAVRECLAVRSQARM